MIFHVTDTCALFIPSAFSNLELLSIDPKPVALLNIILIPPNLNLIGMPQVTYTEPMYFQLTIKSSFEYISKLINTCNETLGLIFCSMLAFKRKYCSIGSNIFSKFICKCVYDVHMEMFCHLATAFNEFCAQL